MISNNRSFVTDRNNRETVQPPKMSGEDQSTRVEVRECIEAVASPSTILTTCEESGFSEQCATELVSERTFLLTLFTKFESKLDSKFECVDEKLNSVKQSIETHRKIYCDKSAETETWLSNNNKKQDEPLGHTKSQLENSVGQITQRNEGITRLKSYYEDKNLSKIQDEDCKANQIFQIQHSADIITNKFPSVNVSLAMTKKHLKKETETIHLLEHRIKVIGLERGVYVLNNMYQAFHERKLFHGDWNYHPAEFIKPLNDYFYLNCMLELGKLRYIQHTFIEDAYKWWKWKSSRKKRIWTKQYDQQTLAKKKISTQITLMLAQTERLPSYKNSPFVNFNFSFCSFSFSYDFLLFFPVILFTSCKDLESYR